MSVKHKLSQLRVSEYWSRILSGQITYCWKWKTPTSWCNNAMALSDQRNCQNRTSTLLPRSKRRWGSSLDYNCKDQASTSTQACETLLPCTHVLSTDFVHAAFRHACLVQNPRILAACIRHAQDGQPCDPYQSPESNKARLRNRTVPEVSQCTSATFYLHLHSAPCECLRLLQERNVRRAMV